MKITKKLLILAAFLVLFGAATWFIYNDFSKDKNINEENQSNVNSNVENNASSTVEISGGDIIADGDVTYEATTIKEQALEIIKRPITAKIQLSEQSRLNIEKQIRAINESIIVKYDDLSQWISLGQYRQALGDYDGAIEAWEFAGLLYPNNSLSYQNLGFLYGFQLKNYLKSEINYLKAIKNEATNSAARLDLVDIYWYNLTDKRSNIEQLLLDGIKADTGINGLNLMSRLAKYYEAIDNKEKAIYYYNEILKQVPDNADVKRALEELNAS